MATKPKTTPAKPSTAVAVKKPTSGNVVSIQDALRAQAAAVGSRIEPPGGNRITVGGKTFKFPDGTKSTGPVELVVVDFVARNEFYDRDFDKDDVTPPACFAIGDNPKELVPSANSPVTQSDTCKGCPMNEFGSKGAGKACSNTRYLAVLPPDADEDTPLSILKVASTGLKSFDGIVASVARTFQTPPVGVVLTIGFDDNVDYPKLEFSNPVPNENLAVHFARQEEARELLRREPDVSSYAAPAPKKAAAGRRR